MSNTDNLASKISKADKAKLFREYFSLRCGVDSDFAFEHAKCKCGREFDLRRLHCPNCGSYDRSAVDRNSSVVRLPDNTLVFGVGYRCRRCHVPYTEVDVFLHCEAPEVQPLMREIRAERKKNEIVQATFGKYGIADGSDLIQRLKALQSKRLDEPAAEDGSTSEAEAEAPLPAGSEVPPDPARASEDEPEPGTPEYYEKHPEEA